MLQKLQHVVNATRRVARKCESHCKSSIAISSQETQSGPSFFNQKCFFHVNPPRMRNTWSIERRRDVLDHAKRLHKVEGEKYSEMDQKISSEMFPTHELPYKLFNGIPFKDLPIVHIHTTQNNTIITLTDKGLSKLVGSCGKEGFKNNRKGTSIAAQTTGNSFAIRALKRGYKTIRVLINGLGPGRLSAVKGLQLGGLEIVSVTDKTLDVTSSRPKKQKRL